VAKIPRRRRPKIRRIQLQREDIQMRKTIIKIKKMMRIYK
jgi:hypothetical protein